MEKRIGTVTVLVAERGASAEINPLLSDFSDIILCRQGLPFHERPVAVISLIVEGFPDRINALTGRLGRMKGVQSKAVLVGV